VTLVNTATGDTQPAKRTLWRVPILLLKPGDYTVTVEQSGFGVAVAKVTVTLGKRYGRFELELGDAPRGSKSPSATLKLQTEDGISAQILIPNRSKTPQSGWRSTYIAQIAPGVTINTSSGGDSGTSARSACRDREPLHDQRQRLQRPLPESHNSERVIVVGRE